MEKLVLIVLAFSLLLRFETKASTKIEENSSVVCVDIYTGHFFSDNLGTPASRTDEYDTPDIALTETPVKRYTQTTKKKLINARPTPRSRTMFYPLLYDLPPPDSHC